MILQSVTHDIYIPAIQIERYEVRKRMDGADGWEVVAFPVQRDCPPVVVHRNQDITNGRQKCNSFIGMIDDVARGDKISRRVVQT